MDKPLTAAGRPPPETPCVRPADLNEPSEARAVLDLLDAYARDPMGDRTGLPPSTRERLIPALKGFRGGLVLLAWQGRRPVGVCVCFPGLSTFRAAPVINIHDLAVLPDARRLGVASRLLRAVEDEARRRGCCKLTLEVREDNRAARTLYARAGYGTGVSGGDPVQYLFLEKRL
jgi:GNAT superfamily N-acetyltransferase